MNAECELELLLPSGHTSVLIVQSGEATVNGEETKAVELALLEREGTSVQINAKRNASILVLTGEPIGEPVVGQGPFVMNTREEIREAIQDYQAGKMGHLK